MESAYRQVGVRGQDYTEVESFAGLLTTLDRLKANVSWRQSLIEEGTVRSREYTTHNIVRKWQVFLEALAIPAYDEWCGYSVWQRQQAMLAAQGASYLNRGARRVRRFLLEALSIFV